MEPGKKDGLPQDVRVIKKDGPWVFYFSPSKVTFFVETTDYHAGPVELTRRDIDSFLQLICNAKEQARNEVVARLEDTLGSIIEEDAEKRALLKNARVELVLPEDG